MTLLSEVFDLDLYDEMLEKGYVRVQHHPTNDLLNIANYTEKASWEGVWNEVTLQCRGLIYDWTTGEVLARPFSKFFNHNEPNAPQFSQHDLFDVYDKMDGSLGILYCVDGEYSIATRGSFASEQAVWATEFFRNKFDDWTPNPNWTYCFEIIYPENRIVVDYGDRKDLTFLGAVDISTGATVDFLEALKTLPVDADSVPVYAFGMTLPMLLTHVDTPKDNFEGYVLHHKESDSRIKIKYEAYKILHKFLTNTSEKHVWEIITTGQDPDIVFAAAPDEFHEWLREVLDAFYSNYQEIYVAAFSAFEKIKKDLPSSYTRKDFALAVKDLPFKSLMFLFEDNDEERIQKFIWQELKPRGSRTVRTVSEDAN